VQATRNHPSLTIGASPRATLALLRAAQAFALIRGEEFITPRHVKQLAKPVLAHRVILRSGNATSQASEALIGEILASVAVPA